MKAHRKKDDPVTIPVPEMAHRLGCALFMFWMFLPALLADDLGLVNPAEKEFGVFQSDMSHTDNFAKKTPALKDRTLPTSPKNLKKTDTIRQVSATQSDPFPMVEPPSVPPMQPFDGGTAVMEVPNVPPEMQNNVMQNNVIPYDPRVQSGYMNFYSTPPGTFLTGMDMGYSQGYSPQLALNSQQYSPEFTNQQGSMMNDGNLFMNPYTAIYPQYGAVADPYSIGYQMDHQTAYQGMPDYSSVYNTMMLQETARQQTEENQKKTAQDKEAEETKKQNDTNWTLNNLVPVRVSSPLGETMLACAKTMSPFYTPSGPDKGVGMPLVNKSWLDHPYYFGGFVGTVSGSELVARMIKQNEGGTGGLIFGYNFNDYWGFESRLHFASIDIYDTAYAKQLIGEQNPGVTILPTSRTNELTLFDVSAHYYPLGNAKWRPYFKYGLGFGTQKFVNSFGYTVSKGVGAMPLGLGLRYWWNERLAIQMDLTNNVIFASDSTKTQHNIAFTVGLTYAFGTGKTKHPVHYWPATPSMGSKW